MLNNEELENNKIQDKRLFALKDIIWSIAFNNGKYSVTPFIFNNDHSEIMDLTTNKRYQASDNMFKKIIEDVALSKDRDCEIRAIKNSFSMEMRTNGANYQVHTWPTELRAKPAPQTLKVWAYNKVVGLAELQSMAGIYENYLNNEYAQRLAVKTARDFGVKENVDFKMPYTDYSNKFEFGDIYWAVFDGGKSVTPFVIIESGNGTEYGIKELRFGEKKRLGIYSLECKSEKIKSTILQMYKGLYNDLNLYKGIEIEKVCSLLVEKDDKDYNNKLIDLEKRIYDKKAVNELSAHYARLIKDKKSYSQKTIDEYGK